MGSVTISNEPQCAVCTTDTSIQLSEIDDRITDAYLSVGALGDRWEIEATRSDDSARFYASEFQMRELRDWLNKTLKD